MAQFLLISSLALVGLPVFAESELGSDLQASDLELAKTFSLEERKSIHQEEVDLVLAEEISYSDEDRLSDFPDLDSLLKNKPKQNTLARETLDQKNPNSKVSSSDCQGLKLLGSSKNSLGTSQKSIQTSVLKNCDEIRLGFVTASSVVSPEGREFLLAGCGQGAFSQTDRGVFSSLDTSMFSYLASCSPAFLRKLGALGISPVPGRNSFQILKTEQNALWVGRVSASNLGNNAGDLVVSSGKAKRAISPASKRKARGAQLAIGEYHSNSRLFTQESTSPSDNLGDGMLAGSILKTLASGLDCLS
ncbi:hypothetical protein EHO59_09920 [Leptospira semungkisensis]|uniref:TIGR04452 family lipoprotein n=1 Tax=Leptospira semungkisensis TaxID=2484985 RepID=A0A4R9FZF0_9LEPT|nr:hypothetical protein [Leptospira semungkisensis]TGK03840.1 hypothetical protein EHO59_09920 [Leptospira semungkisensis]